jgi:hypothetical protein
VFEPPKAYLGDGSILGKTSVSEEAAYTVSCAWGVAWARAANTASATQCASTAT